MRDIHSKQNNKIKIAIANAEFNCRVLGNGIKIVIAFHGFGQDGNSFLPFAIKNPEYTILSVDLPFHGQTKIRDPSLCLTNQEVLELIQKLLDLFAVDRFSLLGFSIGAKLLYPVLERFYSMLDRVWLLSPDGITENFWYRAATKNRLMRYLFRIILDNPQLLKRLGNGSNSLNLIDKRTFFFVLKSLDTKENRDRVFYIWTYLRKLTVNPDMLSKLLNKSNMLVFFILGEKDNIIRESKVAPLSGKIHNSKVVTLSCGHQKLIEYFTDWNSGA